LSQLHHLLLDFVTQKPAHQFYFGFHSVSTRQPVQLNAPFVDSYCGSGSLLKIIKHLHTTNGADTATLVVATHEQKSVMLQFEALVVDEAWLHLFNTVNLTAGGGKRPSDAMIASAHSRVKSWMDCQSVAWMEKAAHLYAEHERVRSKNLSVTPVPILFVKKVPVKKEYRTRASFKEQRKQKVQTASFKVLRSAQNAKHKAKRNEALQIN